MTNSEGFRILYREIDYMALRVKVSDSPVLVSSCTEYRVALSNVLMCQC